MTAARSKGIMDKLDLVQGCHVIATVGLRSPPYEHCRRGKAQKTTINVSARRYSFLGSAEPRLLASTLE